MIGQVSVKNQLKTSIAQFILLCGPAGSGKKTIIKEVFPSAVFMPDIKVDTVRNMIRMLNTQYDTVFVIANADDMSTAGKNALLKVTEECPHNNRIIITVESRISMPTTIISRASLVYMDQYTPSQIFNYYQTLEGFNTGSMSHGMSDADVVVDLCETPGEVNLFVQNGIRPLVNYVQLVIDNIATVSGANAFKIADKVALKDDEEGFDLKLFWKVFMRVCKDSEMSALYKADGILITRRNLQALSIRGINKQFLMDLWILDIREAWFDKDL